MARHWGHGGIAGINQEFSACEVECTDERDGNLERYRLG